MSKSSSKKVVIFDFDGVIADSLAITMEAVNQLAPKYGEKPITKSQALELKEKGLREIMAEHHIPLRKLPGLVRDLHKALQGRVKDIRTFAGVLAEIEGISSRYPVYILSSNDQKVVAGVLGGNAQLFEEIYANASSFKKDRLLKKVIKRAGAGEAIYVGDEVRDVQAAKKAGIKSIAVSWGYNSSERLKEEGPDGVAKTPQELLRLVNRLFELE